MTLNANGISTRYSNIRLSTALTAVAHHMNDTNIDFYVESEEDSEDEEDEDSEDNVEDSEDEEEEDSEDNVEDSEDGLGDYEDSEDRSSIDLFMWLCALGLAFMALCLIAPDTLIITPITAAPHVYNFSDWRNVYADAMYHRPRHSLETMYVDASHAYNSYLDQVAYSTLHGVMTIQACNMDISCIYSKLSNGSSLTRQQSSFLQPTRNNSDTVEVAEDDIYDAQTAGLVHHVLTEIYPTILGPTTEDVQEHGSTEHHEPYNTTFDYPLQQTSLYYAAKAAVAITQFARYVAVGAQLIGVAVLVMLHDARIYIDEFISTYVSHNQTSQEQSGAL